MKRNFSTLSVTIIVILLVIIGLGSYQIYHMYTTNNNKKNENVNEPLQPSSKNDEVEDDRLDTDDKEEENDQDIEENKYTFLGKTSLVLMDCNGSNTIKANIVGGNIVLDNGSKKVTLKTFDAKSMFQESIMTCDNSYLFYIDNANNLFKIEAPYLYIEEEEFTNDSLIDLNYSDYTYEIIATGVTQFIGSDDGIINNKGFNYRYLNVYTTDKKVRSIIYWQNTFPVN